MSVEGQKRRFERRRITSGLLPTPDILRARRHVSKVPKAGIRHIRDILPGTPTLASIHIAEMGPKKGASLWLD
jgi:hypothetical protein